ncbi:ANK-repeat protein MBP1 [Astrocystis sublimbata]|nr:ANK-repeat protein MBP1 [Astrocystis sublimbata]
MVQPTIAAKPAASPGIYSATYSGIPVYEYQFGPELKEHVMRRKADNWINATHILKCAGFDKPARTRILEREVQKAVHEKIQGGYGKYQGTWIPLDSGEQLARRNNIYEQLKIIFEYTAGGESPPPAPRHTSKPKAPRKPAVPKWSNPPPLPPPPPPPREEYETNSQAMLEDDAPDNITIASMSYAADDDRHDLSHFTGHRKRNRDETIQDLTEQQHSIYGDELLDYFLLSRQDEPTFRPEPPPNFQPDWYIDSEKHSALHWASAMGDVDVIKQLKRFSANLASLNCRGETPFMRSVNFTNCYEKQTFPAVMRELFDTIDIRDESGGTVLHHAATMKSGRVQSQSCSRYYIDSILNKLQETHDTNFVHQLLNLQDRNGNTALHLAAKASARKCVRALLGRGASSDIPNNEGERADEMIKELNASRATKERAPQRSSSPFAPDSQRHVAFRDAISESVTKLARPFDSAAASTVQNKIAPMVLEKIQSLARNYEEEWKSKIEAENEARRLLGNTQNELAAVRRQIAELEKSLEPPEEAAKEVGESALAQEQVLSLLAKQSRYHIQGHVEQSLAFMNGDEGENSYETRLRLAHELRDLLQKQREAEQEYVNALGDSGTGEKIDKYRRLLKQCLDRQDAENLDVKLDDLIDLMEENCSEGVGVEHEQQGEPMLIC